MIKLRLGLLGLLILGLPSFAADSAPRENFVSKLMKSLGRVDFKTRFKVKGSNQQAPVFESIVLEAKAPLTEALKWELGQAKDSPYIVLGEKNIFLLLTVKTDEKGELNSLLSFTDIQGKALALPIALKNINSTSTAFRLYQMKTKGSGFGPGSERIDVVADCDADQEALNYKNGPSQPILTWQDIEVCRFTLNYNRKTSQWDYVFEYDSLAK